VFPSKCTHNGRAGHWVAGWRINLEANFYPAMAGDDEDLLSTGVSRNFSEEENILGREI